VSIELTPLGNSCNLACSYCYQTPMKDADPALPSFDVEAMKRGLLDAKPGASGFTLFGGEALLVPLDVLEEMWRWGFERYGQNGVQTNGTLITAAHLELFQRYKVHVGVSLDGPCALNDARWAGSLEKTRLMTERSEGALRRLCAAGIKPSLIVTLNQYNASRLRLPLLIEWLESLALLGIEHVNFHSLEVDHALVGEHLALSHDELIHAYLTLAALRLPMKFEPFEHMKQLLLGNDQHASCVWHACDPYTTAAVQGVDGHGEATNCGRTNKEGVSWRKPTDVGFYRQLALYDAPQADGGCQGCRFFLMCKGQCPGEAIDGDWRNKTEKCGVWMALFAAFEQQLVQAGQHPLSLASNRLAVEQQMLEAWATGYNSSVAAAIRASDSSRADHLPVAALHGDVPHGDEHGDHYDYSGEDYSGEAIDKAGANVT